jgi:transposase-like protein
MAVTRRTPDATRQEAVRLYKSGELSTDICEELGISIMTLYRILRRYGVALRGPRTGPRSTSRPRTPVEVENDIVSLYQGGMFAADVAEQVGCAKATVYVVLRRRRVPIRDRSEAAQTIPTDVQLAIVDRYKQTAGGHRVAREFGVHPTSVYKVLRRHGVLPRKVEAGTRG